MIIAATAPVVVVANRRLALDPKLGIALTIVGVFLFVGFITIIGAVAYFSLPVAQYPDVTPPTAFKSIDQIGQGDENVPVVFTISGDGGGGEADG